MAGTKPLPALAAERLTVSYAQRGPLPLQLDLYPFAPRTPSTSASSSFPPPSSFVLYLHSAPRNPFFAGSKRQVPPWLLTVCRDQGLPLLSADYRLAPEATLSDSWDDLRLLWSFIADEGGLNWAIKSAGGGSEADTGLNILADGHAALQHRGGVDAGQSCIVASGAAAYLGALAGAYLRPAPLALVLLHPILDPTASFYATPSPPLPETSGSRKRAKRLEGVLSRAGHRAQAIVAAADIEGHVEHATSLRSWEPPWWKSRLPSRKDKLGQKEGRERLSLYSAVLRSGQLASVVEPPFKLSELIASPHSRVNTPYPPTFALTGSSDSFIDPAGTQTFMDCLRASEPAAATLDDLFDQSLLRQAFQQMDETADTRELFDPYRRFIHRQVADAAHAFDVFALREDDRYLGEFDAMEAFISHWVSRGQSGLHQGQSTKRPWEKL